MTDSPQPLPTRTRVVLLAYACSPYRGSEGGLGWHRAVWTARNYDTHLVCEEHEFAPEIRRYLQCHGPVAGLTFVFVPKPRWLAALGRLPGCYYLTYRLWHRRAYRVVRRLHAAQPFALAHQVNYCGYREPGYLWKLGVPFVWGPIGGTQNFPWRFLSVSSVRGALHEVIRNVANWTQLRISRHVRRACRAAAVVLAANSTNQADLTRTQGIQPELLLETGLAAVPGRSNSQAAAPGLRLVWSGHHEARKGLMLFIEALGQLPPEVNWEARILGEGAEKRRCQQRAQQLGIAERIKWLGWLPHDQSLAQNHWANISVFTSLRDTSGNVVLEALAAGVPVVALDHQGVHDMLDDESGVRIKVERPAQVVADLAAVLTRLAGDPAWRERLSAGAVHRARRFLWQHQAQRMDAIYRQVLGLPDRAGFDATEMNSASPEQSSAESKDSAHTLECIVDGHASPLPDSSGQAALASNRLEPDVAVP